MRHKMERRNTQESIAEIQSMDKGDSLEKTSKNVKEQKKRIFGESGEPNPDRKSSQGFHEAQSKALADFAQRRYGLQFGESKGKFHDLGRINKDRAKEGQPALTAEQIKKDPQYETSSSETYSGPEKFRSKDQKSNPKPDWRNPESKIETQRHIGAKAHELAHIEVAPEKMNLGDIQEWMDEGTGLVGSKYGGAAKQTELEIQPMAAENPLRARSGLPKFGRPQSSDPRRGMSSKPLTEQSPERVSVDTGRKYATRVKDEEGNPVDLIAQSKNLSQENRQRMQDIDEGILRYNPKQGWQPSSDPNALVNLRGQGRMGEAQSRLKQKYSAQQPSAPSKPSVDLSNLSPEDHAAVQEFLQQRKSKLAASEMDKSDPMGIRSAMRKSDDQYVHLSQDHRMTVNNKPNRFTKELPKNMSDIKEIHSYFGKPMHRMSNKPNPSLGYESYKIGKDGNLTHVASKHDTSD